MDMMNIYEDLDTFHEEEQKKSKELEALEKKYNEALKTIEAITLEKKDLRKKMRIMEQNLQSLLDTAQAEIRRKDKLIEQLRKEKDDICFRRQKNRVLSAESDKANSYAKNNAKLHEYETHKMKPESDASDKDSRLSKRDSKKSTEKEKSDAESTSNRNSHSKSQYQIPYDIQRDHSKDRNKYVENRDKKYDRYDSSHGKKYNDNTPEEYKRRKRYESKTHTKSERSDSRDRSRDYRKSLETRKRTDDMSTSKNSETRNKAYDSSTSKSDYSSSRKRRRSRDPYDENKQSAKQKKDEKSTERPEDLKNKTVEEVTKMPSSKEELFKDKVDFETMLPEKLPDVEKVSEKLSIISNTVPEKDLNCEKLSTQNKTVLFEALFGSFIYTNEPIIGSGQLPAFGDVLDKYGSNSTTSSDMYTDISELPPKSPLKNSNGCNLDKDDNSCITTTVDIHTQRVELAPKQSTMNVNDIVDEKTLSTSVDSLKKSLFACNPVNEEVQVVDLPIEKNDNNDKESVITLSSAAESQDSVQIVSSPEKKNENIETNNMATHEMKKVKKSDTQVAKKVIETNNETAINLETENLLPSSNLETVSKLRESADTTDNIKLSTVEKNANTEAETISLSDSSVGFSDVATSNDTCADIDIANNLSEPDNSKNKATQLEENVANKTTQHEEELIEIELPILTNDCKDKDINTLDTKPNSVEAKDEVSTTGLNDINDSNLANKDTIRNTDNEKLENNLQKSFEKDEPADLCKLSNLPPNKPENIMKTSKQPEEQFIDKPFADFERLKFSSDTDSDDSTSDTIPLAQLQQKERLGPVPLLVDSKCQKQNQKVAKNLAISFQKSTNSMTSDKIDLIKPYSSLNCELVEENCDSGINIDTSSPKELVIMATDTLLPKMTIINNVENPEATLESQETTKPKSPVKKSKSYIKLDMPKDSKSKEKRKLAKKVQKNVLDQNEAAKQTTAIENINPTTSNNSLSGNDVTDKLVTKAEKSNFLLNSTTMDDNSFDEIEKELQAICQTPIKANKSVELTNITVNETNDSINNLCEQASLSANKSSEISFESKRLSLGKSEYLVERTSENVVTMFVTRKPRKKRSKT